jgi:hypothetical protein
MVGGAIFLFIVAAGLVICGISFVVDIKQKVGPTVTGATVDSRDPRVHYTFLRISGTGVAWFVTVLTFILAAGAAVGGIVLLATHH